MGHAMANPTANDTRADTLPSGFVRDDLADSPTTLYAGLGHAERFPDYWELFSPKRGPNGSVNAFDKIKPEKTTHSTSASSTTATSCRPGPPATSGWSRTSSCSAIARA